MLLWIFGDVKQNTITQHNEVTAAGELELEKADISWMLSIDADTLPAEAKAAGKRTFRSLSINDEAFEFSEGFTELHTQSYADIIAGNGFTLADTKKAIALVHDIRNHNR